MSSDDDEHPRPFSAFLPYRLSARHCPQDERGADALEALLAPETEHVRRAAMEWQTPASADFWEAGSVTSGVERDRCTELAGIIGSAGEQLALAHGAAGDVARWANADDSGPLAIEMGMRAMAEHQANYAIGCGHAIVNVVARMLCCNTAIADKCAGRSMIGTRFPPFSNDRRDWIPLTEVHVDHLRRVTRDAHADREVAALLTPCRSLVKSTEWKHLDERRGEDHHRWRPRTRGTAGVNRATLWRGNAIGVGVAPRYTDGDGLAIETALIADAATVRVADAMLEILKRWYEASELLTGLGYRDSTTGQVFGRGLSKQPTLRGLRATSRPSARNP